MSENREQIEQDLDKLDERSEQFFQDCKLRSAMRLAKEATRTAKSHQHAVHYMRGLFDQMRFGHGLLQPQEVREAAIQLIMLLKDEEHARKIQPDLDEGHYHWVCSWMSTCAYDNLAEATGLMSGYNSEGMHECINEGIQVCRETGKMECVGCFREYAADVYTASDDLEMVRHQCQTLMEFRPGQDSKDRRWSAWHKLAGIHLLEGRLVETQDDLKNGMDVSQDEHVYLKQRAALLIGVSWDQANLLAGKPRFDWEELKKQGIEPPEAGEWPKFEMEVAQCEALAACLSKDYEQAIKILTDWDRRLTELECLKEWFEVRLRLIAAYLLSDQKSRAEALAKGLDAKAHESQDYLTISRLQRMMTGEGTLCPIPLLADPDTGPFCSASRESALESDPTPIRASTIEKQSVPAAPSETDDDEATPATPLAETLAGFMQRMVEAQGDDDERHALLNEFVTYTPEKVEDAHDAAYLVHLSQFVVQGSEDAQRVWPWARNFLSAFPEDGTVLSVVATLGAYFRGADEETFGEVISVEDLEKWFRRSLTLNSGHPRNHARAGTFFLEQGNVGEAERCLARASRLDRKDGNIANQLADIYRQTDRPRDALAVLDLCLRSETDDPSVAWEAAMTALQLERYDSLLTYLDKHRELAKESPLWENYYRSIALLHTGQPAKAIQAADAETEHEDCPGTFHLDLVRASAHADLSQQQQAEESVSRILQTPMSSIDYLSLNGLLRLTSQLLFRVLTWDENHPLRKEFVNRLLSTGLLPDDYFEQLRDQRETVAGLHFYRVQIRQQLDENWPESFACLPMQQEWPDYDIDWGVLASSEEEAVAVIRELQSQCYPGPNEIIELEESEDEYTDKPGIVWQGYRRCETAEEYEEPDFLDEDE
ncbi:MAG: tetratricopeptide repeat protein [Planctomycetaceae bacterium]|nr:tetratricopeptide repeat protein [Planctomycetaceae bacterium]